MELQSDEGSRLADAIEARAAADMYAAVPAALEIRTEVVGGATVLLAPRVPVSYFNRAIGLAAPGVDLREAFEDQCAIVNILRNRHQIDRVLRLANGQILLAQSGIDLSKDSNRPRVLRLDHQSLRENLTAFTQGRSHTR